MSGPKVVRIVTREEIQAMCRGLMHAFESAGRELVQQAERYGMLNDAIEKDIEGRRERLSNLFNNDQWADFQKLAPAMTEYLAAETARLRAQALAAAEAARSKRRHLADSARSLVMSFENSKRPVPQGLREIACKALEATDEQLASMQAVVQQTLRSTSRPGAGGENGALAKRLGVGDHNQTFAEWKAEQLEPTSDASSLRLDKLLAEIEIDEDPEVARGLVARAAEIAGEASEQRRILLTDSLILDVATRTAQRRELENSLAKLREVKAALEGLATPSAIAMSDTIKGALERRDTSAAARLIADGKILAERETHELVAVARRRAMLSGLASLGYEVREGMTTSWVRDGRIVLRRPGTPDYGIELGAPADAARLQIRLVASDRPSTPRSAQRDRDQETIWCSEFGRLQGLVAKSSGELILERAQPVGAVAVKSVAMGNSTEEARDIASPVETRMLK